jgi:hypothetical protein
MTPSILQVRRRWRIVGWKKYKEVVAYLKISRYVRWGTEDVSNLSKVTRPVTQIRNWKWICISGSATLLRLTLMVSCESEKLLEEHVRDYSFRIINVHFQLQWTVISQSCAGPPSIVTTVSLKVCDSICILPVSFRILNKRGLMQFSSHKL